MSNEQFQSQVLSHSAALQSFAYRLTQDVVNSQDLVQETQLKALSKRALFRDGTNLKAWLFTIMKNLFINAYRKTKRQYQISDQETASNFFERNGYVEDKPAESYFLREELSKALRTVDQALRTPFLMHFQGFKYLEIAEKMGIPVGTVKSRIFLAKRSLRKQLSEVYC